MRKWAAIKRGMTPSPKDVHQLNTTGWRIMETGNQTGQVAGLNNDHLVELMVIETTTSSMRTKRSTN